MSRVLSLALGAIVLSSCLDTAVESPLPSYHNPLDYLDAGTLPPTQDGGGSTDGGLPRGPQSRPAASTG